MSESEETLPLALPSRLRTIPYLTNYPQLKSTLQRMADQEYDSHQILQILRKFKNQSDKDCYGDKRQYKSPTFQMLQKLYYAELPELMAKITQFVLLRWDYELILLKRRENGSLALTKQAVLYMICMMSLCLVPKQEYHQQSNKNFAYQLDFSFIFSHNKYKTKTVVEYIRKEIIKTAHYQEKLAILRVSTNQSIEALLEQKGTNRMCSLKMAGDNQNIQNYFGCLKIDFANAFIGGGALSTGCVQEEIMFSNHPQLFITPLLCQRMEHNQAIILVGFKKYSCNSGYSYKTNYLGPQFHKYQYDQHNRAKEYIAAIDAMSFPKHSKQQFRKINIRRELLKSYTGFNFTGVDKVVTGNWGCGAFGGDLKTKFLIQWISCSLAGKQLIYCPFGQRQKLYNKAVLGKISEMSVIAAYKMLVQASRSCYKESHNKSLDQISIYQHLNFDQSEQNKTQSLQTITYEVV